jgi:hypothetical protein
MYAHLEIDVQNAEIVVSLPRTNYRVSYCKSANSPSLCGKSFPTMTDPRAPICQAKFLAYAWQAANKKAQELRWFARSYQVPQTA